MKSDTNESYSPKIQKLLNKLISEEHIAHDFYVAAVNASAPAESELFADAFIDTANDEKRDHEHKLVQWAIKNDYDVPVKYAEFMKHADESVSKQFDALKRGKEAAYYVKEAIKSEQLAIKSYADVLESDDAPYELHCIIMQNYFDEIEHLETLNTLMFACDAGAVLI